MARKIKSRRKRLEEVVEQVNISLVELEALRDEMVNWYEGMDGTNLEHTMKFTQVEECADMLDNIVSTIEDARDESMTVEFPGMF